MRYSRRQFMVLGGASAALADWSLVEAQTPAVKDEFAAATIIAGKPRERGRAYGKAYRDGVHSFLDKEIYGAFIQKPSPKDAMLRYAGACAKSIKEVCPIIHDEMEGMAEAAGLKLEALTLIALHEELYHRGVLPKVEHCTAVAAGPPMTKDNRTYVGQTWDWMESVFGMSSVVEWQRPVGEGPSVLGYGFPGLWVGAGLNANGLALSWTSADLGKKGVGARVGVPAYTLLTHFLYQESLDAAAEEARRAKHAGWFTFVMGDGKGNLLNIEGSPEGIAVESGKGHMARIGFGTRKMSGTPDDKPVKLHARCVKMNDLLVEAKGKIDREAMQHFFADPKCAISVGKPTIDMMVFDCTQRKAYLSRGPSYKVAWKEFGFTEK